MKILITTDWYTSAINGVVTSVCNLASGLEKLGHEVRILTLSEKHSSHTEASVSYLGSFSASFIYPKARVHFVGGKSVMEELLAWKPDIVHSNCEFSTFRFARKIAAKLQIPLFHTYHTVYEDYAEYVIPMKKLGRNLAAKLSKSIVEKTDHIIVPSEKIEVLLRSYGVTKPISVVPTGIRVPQAPSVEDTLALRSRLGIGKGETMVLSAGRLAKEKNCDELLQHFSQYKNPAAKLVFVGDGPHREHLEAMVKKLALEKRVVFTGMVSPQDIFSYYYAADIFACASTSETQGLTYYEALCCGLPLLCKKDDAINHILFDGENGYAFHSESDFYTALDQMVQSSQFRGTLSKRSLQISRSFDYINFASGMEKLYYSSLP